MIFGVLTIVAGLMPGFVSFAVLLVPTGAAALVFAVANNSYVQLGVDPQMRGRVMALYFMCFMGGTPLGAPLIGWISEHLGAPWGLILGGAVCVLAALGAGAWLARGRRVRLERQRARPWVRLRVGALAAAVPTPGCGPPRRSSSGVPAGSDITISHRSSFSASWPASCGSTVRVTAR